MIGAGTDGSCGAVTIEKDANVRLLPPEPIDLSTLSGDYEAKDGDILTGKRSGAPNHIGKGADGYVGNGYVNEGTNIIYR